MRTDFVAGAGGAEWEGPGADRGGKEGSQAEPQSPALPGEEAVNTSNQPAISREALLRLGAAVVVLLIVLAGFVSKQPRNVLIMTSPLLAGAVFPLFRPGRVTEWLENREGELTRRLETARTKKGKFSRFFTQPLLGGSLAIWRGTRLIGDPHLRAGVRVSAGLLFAIVMLAGLLIVGYIVIGIVIAGLMLLLVLWALGKMAGGEKPASGDEAEGAAPLLVGPRGTRLVKESLLFDTPTGIKITDDGRVVKEGIFRDTPTGRRIDSEGRLVTEGLFIDTPTGTRIDPDGRIVRESTLFEHPTGVSIGPDGRVLEEGLLGDTPTGLKFQK
jgi:hypothetical protein